MNTATHTKIPTLRNEVDLTSAPPSVVKRVQNEILISIQNRPITILLTGESKKGKTTLLRTISTKVAVNERMIFLNGPDLLSSYSKDNSEEENDFNSIKDFIHESALLGEELTVIVDSADCLPTNILQDLFTINEQLAYSDSGISLILGGSPKLKNQLENIEDISLQDFIHCSLDELNETDIRIYSTKKDYRIKPRNDELQFDRSALSLLAKHVSGNLQHLDVLLEWCSALAYKTKTSSITTDIVNQAVAFAKQSAKDSGAQLENSYPTQKEINRLIANISFRKEKQKSSTPITQTKKSDNLESIAAVIPKIAASKDNETLDYSHSEIAELEKEVMPTQWVSTSNSMAIDKKSSFIMQSIAPLLVIGLITLIYFQLRPFILDKDLGIDDENIEQDYGNVESPRSTIIENETIEETAEPRIIAEELPTTIDPLPDKEIETVADQVEPPAIAEELPTTIDPLPGKEIETVADQVEPPAIVEELPTTIDPLPGKEIETVTDQEVAVITVPEKSASEESVMEPSNEDKALTKIDNTQNSTDASVQQDRQQITSPYDDPEVVELLALASQQFEAKNLTTPPGENALETYQSILSKYPNYLAAKQGIKNIHERYVSWANYYMRNDDLDRSIYFFKKALEVDPDDQVSQQVLRNLDTQLVQANTLSETETSTINANKSDVSMDDNDANNLLVGTLLIKAKQQLQNKNLTSPPNDNAFETYKQVLQTDPNNDIALQGISIIKKSYVSWAEQDLKKNNPHRAALFYKKALAIDPADKQLVQRLEEIKSLRTTQSSNP